MTTSRPFNRRQEQLHLFRKMLAHTLFRRVVSRCGIDLRGSWWRGSEELIFRALRTCADCQRKTACRAWLEGREPCGPYPPFCPNGPTIEACRLMAPHAPQALGREGVDSKDREPGLGELLESREVQQVMKADRVDVGRLRTLLAKLMGRSSERQPH